MRRDLGFGVLFMARASADVLRNAPRGVPEPRWIAVQGPRSGCAPDVPGSSATEAAPMNTTADVIQLDDVRKVYGHGDGAVVALAGVTLGFQPGSFTAVMGPSGSGKST